MVWSLSRIACREITFHFFKIISFLISSFFLSLVFHFFLREKADRFVQPNFVLRYHTRLKNKILYLLKIFIKHLWHDAKIKIAYQQWPVSLLIIRNEELIEIIIWFRYRKTMFKQLFSNEKPYSSHLVILRDDRWW